MRSDMADDIFDVRNPERASSSWRQLQDLIGDAAGVQARWARAVVTTARAAGRGEVRSTSGLLKDVGSEYGRYLRDLGKLNLHYARALQELAAASGDRFTEAVEDATRPARKGENVPKHAESMPRVPPTTPTTSRRARVSTAKKTPAKKAAVRKSTTKRTATKAAAKAPARARRTPPARG
jgi:hypothetical protein